MTTALVINTDGSNYKLELGERSLSQLQEVVGGYIDAVRGDDFVGYVNDEGLLIGLDYNPVASSLFGRTLVGDVVIVGAFSADGEYDGADHNVPDHIVSIVQQYSIVTQLVNDILNHTPENSDTPL